MCRGRVEFAHLKSEGTGGADRGNGVGLCSAAHRWDADSLHVMGCVSFPAYWGVDLERQARWLATHDQEDAGR